MSDISKDSLANLRRVVSALLGPDGCPWDQKQTPRSLCDYVLEEASELVEAVRADDPQGALEEMGDLLFLVCFLGALYEAKGAFTLNDAFDAARAKMIRRHPHVFAGAVVNNQEELLRNWERIKRSEKGGSQGSHGIFDSLPSGLPALLKAYRLNAKAARHHFTWESDQAQCDALKVEWDELQHAVAAKDANATEAEFGDYLFSLVEYGRRLGVKANAALEGANAKFLSRFRKMEELAQSRGLDTALFNLADWDTLWDEVKAGE